MAKNEYAEEMWTVFEQMVLEHGSALSLVELMASELWDLPASLLREYSRERNLRLQGVYGMTAMVIPMRAFRFLVGTLLGIFILYCLLILLPYFYNGLNSVSWDGLTSGRYDPKGYVPFSDDGMVGIVTRLLGILVIIAGPVAVAAMGGVLTLTLLRHWWAFGQNQRAWGIAAIGVAAFMLALAFSPFGRMLLTWFMD